MTGIIETLTSDLANDESLSIIITLPSDIEWQDYKSELFAAAAGDILNFKVPALPQHVEVGARCYLVHRGYIKGWQTICGFSEKEFVCTTTGKPYKGKFIERTGKFNYLPEPIPYKGFQGFRYFKLSNYLSELRGDILKENYELTFDEQNRMSKK